MKNTLKSLRSAYFHFPRTLKAKCSLTGTRSGKWKYAVMIDFREFLKVLLHALKAFIWPLLVSVRLHFAFKVCGKWKYTVLSDFNEFFKVPRNALKAFIWPLLVSVRLHFAFKVCGKWKYAVLSDFSGDTISKE